MPPVRGQVPALAAFSIHFFCLAFETIVISGLKKLNETFFGVDDNRIFTYRHTI